MGNGSGGDLVGIQASRMTTYLHKATKSLLGTFPEGEDKILQLPCSTLCGDLPCYRCGSGKEETKQPHAMPGRVLLSLLFPGHTIFVFIIFTVKIHDNHLLDQDEHDVLLGEDHGPALPT